MSGSDRSGAPFAKFAYKSGARKGGADASAKGSNRSHRNNSDGKRSPRRVVEEDDDDDDDDVVTSPDIKRTVPRNGASAAAAAAAARAAARDEGTSSGEDEQWFKKPSAESAITVKRANAMNTTSNPGWMSKNDPKRLTDADRRKNIERAKAQRAQQKKKGSSGTRGTKNLKGGDPKRGAAAGGKGRRQRGEGGGRDDDSEEESCGDSEDEEDEEGEFESGDDDESEDDEPDLDDESEQDSEEEEEVALALALSSSAATTDTKKKRPATPPAEKKTPNPWTKSKGASSATEKSRGVEKSGAAAGTSSGSRGNGHKEGSSSANRSFGSSGVNDKKRCDNRGGVGGGGASSGGDGKAANRVLKGAVAGMDVEIASSSSKTSSSSNSKRDANGSGGGRVGARAGSSGGGASSSNAASGAVKSGIEWSRRQLEGGDKAKGDAGDGGVVRRTKSKRKIVAIAEDESDEDGEDEVVVVPHREVPQHKKRKKVMEVADDDMDDSDRGSDSEDDGARARKVLEECSAVSKKLGSVLSSWAASDGNGDGGGALGLTHMKQGARAGGAEGKSMTTTEEIQEACPGLILKPYQLVGVNWMSLLRGVAVNGVLADEMGLGKTVQSIAFFALLRHRRRGAPPKKPHLVVVPSSVLDNWDSELKKFCPALEVVKYHGSQKGRSAIRQSLNRVSTGADPEDMPDIVLTTYVMWERESCGDDRNFLKRFKYDYMVLDEGHSIKNIKSSRFQRLRMVSCKHRLLLSGTPVQNNLGELLSLLSFLMPNIFKYDVIETLLEFLGDGESHTPPASAVSSSSSLSPSSSTFQVREVRGMLAPFVLRRLKSGVLKQLVAKTERLELVPLSKVQKSVYDGVLEEHVRQKRAAIERSLASENVHCQTPRLSSSNKDDSKRSNNPNGISSDGQNGKTTRSSVASNAGKNRGAGRGGADGKDASSAAGVDDESTEGGGKDKALEDTGISAKEIKNVFTELRKGANHPLMLLNYFKGGGKLEEVITVLHRTGYFGPQATRDMVMKEVQTYNDFDLHQVCSGFDSLRHLCLPEKALWTSAKMERLRTLLPELVAQGHRILLFSQWTRLLDLLEVLLQDAMGLTFCRLDGSTPVSERKALIDKFSSDRSIPVFLLSTRAGGLGINLTSADTVILHDCDFNPENDRQAEDRCHRIGQTKPVTVIKMVAQGTVDEDIYSMGERKKEVNKSVLNDAAAKEQDAASTISGILKKAIQVHLAVPPSAR